MNGKPVYCFRAIDEAGQVVDAYVSERRNAAAAQSFFERAISETDVQPQRVTTDKAKCYPPALRAVLHAAEHRRSRYLNTGLERDHGHMKQLLAPMRGFKRLASADAFCQGHALIRNLPQGFWALTEGVPRALRLATEWPILASAASEGARHCITLEGLCQHIRQLIAPIAHSATTRPMALSKRVPATPAAGPSTVTRVESDESAERPTHVLLDLDHQLERWAGVGSVDCLPLRPG